MITTVSEPLRHQPQRVSLSCFARMALNSKSGTAIALKAMASLAGHSAWQQNVLSSGREAFGLPDRHRQRLVIRGKRRVENLVAQKRRVENLIAQTTGVSSPAELRLLRMNSES